VKHELTLALEEAGAVFGSCTDGNKTTREHQDECERLSSAIRLLDTDALPREEAARQVVLLTSSYSAKRSGKALQFAADALKEARERAAADAMTLLIRELTLEFIELVRAYELEYRELKRERSLLDFDDLQTAALALLRARPEVAAEYRELFRYTMVDEFQDTDALQLGIVEQVAGSNLCTVGDERQSIYGFRGANIEVYRAHVRDMLARGAFSVELGRNYRSHEEILGFVNRLFGSDELFGGSLIRLQPSREGAESRLPEDAPRVRIRAVRKPGFSSASVRATEARAVADEFATLRDRFGFPEDEMVVLLRAYTHAEEYAEALRERGFSVVVQGGSRFFGLGVVQAMRALVDAIANADNDEALAVLCASQLGRISDSALWQLRRPAGEQRLWAALQGDLSALAECDRFASRRVADALARARSAVGHMPLAEILLRAVEDLALDVVLAAKGDAGQQDLANVLKFARLADAFEAGGGVGPSEFSAYIRAKEEFRDHEAPAAVLSGGAGVVRIMSMHAAKGLEFPVVALPELASGGYSRRGIALSEVRDSCVMVALRPPRDWLDLGENESCVDGTPLGVRLEADEKTAQLDESKRLFYVGCTRAREVLVLTGSLNTSGPTANSMFSWVWPAVAAQAPADDESGRVLFGEHEIDVSVLVPQAEFADREPEVFGEAELFEVPLAGTRAPAELVSAPARLSYSHFAAYKACPKRFLATYVAGMRERAVTGGTTVDPRTFGSAVHAVLETAAGTSATDELMRRMSGRFGLDSEKAAELGAAVRAFERSQWARRAEQATLTRREAPFALRIGDGEGFVLFGSIDLYAEDGDGALIVDYKTGRSGSRDELEDRYALQAKCYGLAALRTGASNVELAFVRPQVTEDDGSMQAVTYRFGPDDQAQIEAELLGQWQAMARGEYAPLDRWDPYLCPTCPIANGICPTRA
jgi:ATP-dependent exoDNAse (exonuclease V) beta subunit